MFKNYFLLPLVSNTSHCIKRYSFNWISVSQSISCRAVLVVLHNNNMKAHPSKTKELIVSRPRSKSKIDPLRPFIDGAERVSTLKVLGVVLDSRLTMSEHVSRVLSACASSTFALRLLRTHGLGSDQLHLVAIGPQPSVQS